MNKSMKWLCFDASYYTQSLAIELKVRLIYLKLILLIALFCCSFIENIFSKNVPKSYFNYINKANKALYHNDFREAIKYFDLAFNSQAPINYYFDLKKAVIVNHKMGDNLKVYKYLKEIYLSKGITTQILEKEFDFIDTGILNQISQFKRRIKINIALKREMEILYKEDQQIRKYYRYEYNNINPTRPLSIQRREQIIDSIDEVHLSKLIKLIKKHGFPNENNVGLMLLDSININFIIDILNRHFFNNSLHDKYSIILKDALTKGQIHPAVYAKYFDDYASQVLKWTDSRLYHENIVVSIDSQYYRPFIFYSKGMIDSINFNRSEIGLDSFHLAQKQIVCQRCCQERFKSERFLNIYPFVNINIFTLGFVKYAIEKANKSMDEFRLNVNKILEECKCEEKKY